MRLIGSSGLWQSIRRYRVLEISDRKEEINYRETIFHKVLWDLACLHVPYGGGSTPTAQDDTTIICRISPRTLGIRTLILGPWFQPPRFFRRLISRCNVTLTIHVLPVGWHQGQEKHRNNLLSLRLTESRLFFILSYSSSSAFFLFFLLFLVSSLFLFFITIFFLLFLFSCLDNHL